MWPSMKYEFGMPRRYRARINQPRNFRILPTQHTLSVSLGFSIRCAVAEIEMIDLSWIIIINYNKLITQRTIYCHRGIKLLLLLFFISSPLLRSPFVQLQMRARLPIFPTQIAGALRSTSNKTKKMANGTHDIAFNFVHLLFSLSLRVFFFSFFFFSPGLSFAHCFVCSFDAGNGLKHKLTLSNINYLKRRNAPAQPELRRKYGFGWKTPFSGCGLRSVWRWRGGSEQTNIIISGRNTFMWMRKKKRRKIKWK